MCHVLLINFEVTKRFADANAKYIFSVVKNNQFQILQWGEAITRACREKKREREKETNFALPPIILLNFW